MKGLDWRRCFTDEWTGAQGCCGAESPALCDGTCCDYGYDCVDNKDYENFNTVHTIGKICCPVRTFTHYEAEPNLTMVRLADIGRLPETNASHRARDLAGLRSQTWSVNRQGTLSHSHQVVDRAYGWTLMQRAECNAS